MKYCQKCGKQMEDDSKFCPNCGAVSAAQEVPAVQRSGGSGKRLHCPECGSGNFAPIVESTNNGGYAVSGAMSKRSSMTAYRSSTTHRNYWICQDCGTKFRNIQNLKEELAADTKRLKPALVMLVISVVGAVFFLCGFLSNDRFELPEAFTFMMFTFTVFLFGHIWLVTKKKVAQMTAELAYLESHCFDQ